MRSISSAAASMLLKVTYTSWLVPNELADQWISLPPFTSNRLALIAYPPVVPPQLLSIPPLARLKVSSTLVDGNPTELSVGVSDGVAVGGKGVFVAVGGKGVLVAVDVGRTGVLVGVVVSVGGRGVPVTVGVGKTGVLVGVLVSTAGVLVGVAVAVGDRGVAVGVLVGGKGVGVGVGLLTTLPPPKLSNKVLLALANQRPM